MPPTFEMRPAESGRVSWVVLHSWVPRDSPPLPGCTHFSLQSVNILAGSVVCSALLKFVRIDRYSISATMERSSGEQICVQTIVSLPLQGQHTALTHSALEPLRRLLHLRVKGDERRPTRLRCP